MTYRRFFPMIAGLWLASCGQSSEPVSPTVNAIDQGSPQDRKVLQQTELPKARDDTALVAAPSKHIPKRKLPVVDEPSPPVQSQCWQDYCPCDPVETVTDKWICRNLRGGVDVSDDVMSMGAMQRDSARSLRQWNRENPDMAPISIPAPPDTE
jgi:hypothetical protein